jgi:hypothetical protein
LNADNKDDKEQAPKAEEKFMPELKHIISLYYFLAYDVPKAGYISSRNHYSFENKDKQSPCILQ